MALVDYASSDEESENECEQNETEVTNGPKESHEESNSNNEKVNDNSLDKNEELFSSLPKPRRTFILEDDNKLSKLLLNKNSLFSNKKENVKIAVPSMSEFEDVKDEPVAKKIKPSAKGAGLFSVLPPPKHNTVKETDFVPRSVSKTQIKKSSNKIEVCSKFFKKPVGNETVVNEDDDDDAPIGSSFFGSSLTEEKPITEPESTNPEETSVDESVSDIPLPGNSLDNNLEVPAPKPEQYPVMPVEESNQTYSTDPSQNPEVLSADDNPLDLDEKALQILCGNKKKRKQMPMNIIDLSGEEILPDSKEWLLKQFTEEKNVGMRSHKKSGGPSSQSRRKHQITYLAYQAKEQELELQNQWAANRMSRKQTQQKYGF